VPPQAPRVTSTTQLGPWGRGSSDEAACETCEWAEGPERDRVLQYAARRHVHDTGHVVIQYRTWNRAVFLADDQPLELSRG
jgi:hypothetical protein